MGSDLVWHELCVCPASGAPRELPEWSGSDNILRTLRELQTSFQAAPRVLVFPAAVFEVLLEGGPPAWMEIRETNTTNLTVLTISRLFFSDKHSLGVYKFGVISRCLKMLILKFLPGFTFVFVERWIFGASYLVISDLFFS